MNCRLLILFSSVFVSTALITDQAIAAGFDLLGQERIKIDSIKSEEVLNRMVSSPRAIFLRYKPGLDSGSELVAPVQVGGTNEQPTLKLSIRKCVFLICQTVDLDAAISIQSTQGKCTKNYVMIADLRRSSALLAELYDRMQVQICYQKTSDGRGSLDLTAHARQAPQYEGGIVQRQVFQMMQLQTQPILTAVKKTLADLSVKLQ